VAKEGKEQRRTWEPALRKVVVVLMAGRLGQRVQEEQKENLQNAAEMRREGCASVDYSWRILRASDYDHWLMAVIPQLAKDAVAIGQERRGVLGHLDPVKQG
jgi:hypothetical protein